VTSVTRDRLKQLAKRDACTIDEYLNKLIAMAYREQRWDALRASVEQMTPHARADYDRESDDYRPDTAWDGVVVDDEWQSEWDQARTK